MRLYLLAFAPMLAIAWVGDLTHDRPAAPAAPAVDTAAPRSWALDRDLEPALADDVEADADAGGDRFDRAEPTVTRHRVRHEPPSASHATTTRSQPSPSRRTAASNTLTASPPPTTRCRPARADHQRLGRRAAQRRAAPIDTGGRGA